MAGMADLSWGHQLGGGGGGGGVADGMQGLQLHTHPGTHLHGCMLGTSLKAISWHWQSGKDCPAVHPCLQWHRGYDLPRNPPAEGATTVTRRG